MEGGRRHSSTRASRTKHPTSIKQDQLRRTSGADTPCPRPQNRPLDFFLIGCSEPYVPLVAAYGSSKPRGHAGWLTLVSGRVGRGARVGTKQAPGGSPSRVALKIRCRSRRTSPRSPTSRPSPNRPCPGRSPAEDPPVRSPYRRLTCPSVPAALANHSSKAHLPKWARFRARAHGPVSGQLYEPTSGGLIDLVRFPVAFRPPALASWASCTRRGLGPSLPPAYRHPLPAWRTPTGFPCSTRMRHDWGWVPSLPRGRWCPHGRARSLAAICRLPTARPLSSRRSTRPGMCG
jgi:hypothetical protein